MLGRGRVLAPCCGVSCGAPVEGIGGVILLLLLLPLPIVRLESLGLLLPAGFGLLLAKVSRRRVRTTAASSTALRPIVPSILFGPSSTTGGALAQLLGSKALVSNTELSRESGEGATSTRLAPSRDACSHCRIDIPGSDFLYPLIDPCLIVVCWDAARRRLSARRRHTP